MKPAWCVRCGVASLLALSASLSCGPRRVQPPALPAASAVRPAPTAKEVRPLSGYDLHLISGQYAGTRRGFFLGCKVSPLPGRMVELSCLADGVRGEQDGIFDAYLTKIVPRRETPRNLFLRGWNPVTYYEASFQALGEGGSPPEEWGEEENRKVKALESVITTFAGQPFQIRGSGERSVLDWW